MPPDYNVSNFTNFTGTRRPPPRRTCAATTCPSAVDDNVNGTCRGESPLAVAEKLSDLNRFFYLTEDAGLAFLPKNVSAYDFSPTLRGAATYSDTTGPAFEGFAFE